MRNRLIYLASALLLLILCEEMQGQILADASQTFEGASHGTINVVLANGHGMVVLTDSRLTNEQGQHQDSGVKLFQLDDHTVCAVAGWYTDPGPSAGDKNYPAYISAPLIISRYAADLHTFRPTDSMEKKLDDIATTFQFVLYVSANVRRAFGLPPNLSRSQITIASLEQGKFKLAHVAFVPYEDKGIASYVREAPQELIAKDGLIYWVAGVDSVAKPILDGAFAGKANTQKSAILDYLYEEVKANKGTALALTDLQMIAKKLKLLTAQQDNGVGGEAQQALFSPDGMVLNQPLPPMQIKGPSLGNHFALVEMGSFHFINEHPEVPIIGIVGTESRQIGGYFTGGIYENGRMDLDGNIYIGTHFIKCTITYTGTMPFVLDRSNKFDDSVILLSDNVDPSSPEIEQVRKDFPNLRITGGIPKSK